MLNKLLVKVFSILIKKANDEVVAEIATVADLECMARRDK